MTQIKLKKIYFLNEKDQNTIFKGLISNFLLKLYDKIGIQA